MSILTNAFFFICFKKELMWRREKKQTSGVLEKVCDNAVTELSCGVNWFSRTICSWGVGRLPNRQVFSQSPSDLIWQRCYSQSYDCCFFSTSCTFSQNVFSPSQADCRYAATVEPNKTDGALVSLSHHKLLHSHNSAVEPCVMDTDILTTLLLSLKVYPLHVGVMLDHQLQTWRNKQSDILHPVTLLNSVDPI